ncbi:MAG: CopG antitoxin of type toxin-antitoxin system [Actinomycetota bacterium]
MTTQQTLEWYRNWYRLPMAMNLRLPEALAEALRALAQETGRSQQDLAREALEEYVRDYRLRAYPKEVRHLITPAQRRLNDPQALEELRTAWANVDTKSLLAALLEDRRTARY